MPKVIIYLDQNFVSNMAKARAGIIKDDKWLTLYGTLESLVHEQERVICPVSIFHEIESSFRKELLPAIHDVVIRLAWGLKLIPWEEAFRFQVYRAMRRFLDKEEEPPHWREAFRHDPHEPLKKRAVEIGGQQFLVGIAWDRFPEFIEGDERIKKRYPKVMADVKKQLAGKDFERQVEEEKRAFVDFFYIAPAKRAAAAFLSEKVPSTLSELGVVFGRAELSLLQSMWKDLGGEKARLAHFLASDHFRACPFLDIQSRLYAALNIFDADRLPEPGDYYDTQIIATAMPHCKVLALDGYMKQLVERIKLDQKYGVKIFSAKKDDFEGLLAFLAEL